MLCMFFQDRFKKKRKVYLKQIHRVRIVSSFVVVVVVEGREVEYILEQQQEKQDYMCPLLLKNVEQWELYNSLHKYDKKNFNFIFLKFYIYLVIIDMYLIIGNKLLFRTKCVF